MRKISKAQIYDEAWNASRGFGTDVPFLTPAEGEAAYMAVLTGQSTGLGDAFDEDGNLAGITEDLNALVAGPVNLVRTDIARAERALKMSTVASGIAAGCALLMLVVLGAKR